MRLTQKQLNQIVTESTRRILREMDDEIPQQMMVDATPEEDEVMEKMLAQMLNWKHELVRDFFDKETGQWKNRKADALYALLNNKQPYSIEQLLKFYD